MTLASGTRLGPYEILDVIGVGGMGEVYKARDTRLDRTVAVKVLPADVSADSERQARFAREAKTVAGLSHPHICTLHDVGKDGGSTFLVMEFVEGETLATRILKGPMPVGEAVYVCRQIAEGVAAAHDKGIVHRDLKPANVIITPDGVVKVLDFGLARAIEDLPAPGDSPTVSPLTRSGVVVGTVAYMSPEQASGQHVDRRADIWAFGCILYECLTGRRAFEGETVTDTLAAIYKIDPDWELLPQEARTTVRGVLQRCLTKNPKLRYRDIGDAWLDLAAPLGSEAEPAGSRRPRSSVWLAAGAALVLLAGISLGRWMAAHPRSAPLSVVMTTVKVEAGHWLDGMRRPEEMERPSRTAIAISTDGRLIVYSAIEEDLRSRARPRLFLRRIDQTEAKAISGSEGGISPFFSPDARWVGFWADGKLKKIPIEGGAPTPLCDLSTPFGASWGPRNNIVFASRADGGLSRISAEGGNPETLTTPDPKRDEKSHRLPFWLPDGNAVLFTVMRHTYDSHPWVALLDLDSREWHVLLREAADVRYVPTGHLVFLRHGTLMGVRFDLATRKVIGQPLALVEGIMHTFSPNFTYNTGAGQFDISDAGSLVYAGGGMLPELKSSLVWVDHKGTEQPVTDLELPFFAPRLSPDGERIAYIFYGYERRLWVYDVARGTNSLLTEQGMSSFPIWSPDGKRLLFGWQKSVTMNIFQQAFDGSSAMERVTTSDADQRVGSWSSDGKTVALVESHVESGFDISLLDTRSGRVTPFLNTQYAEASPDISPDNRWIAYTTDESKRSEIYVRPIAGAGKYRISSDGGTQPLWARNGKQLFYRWQDQVWAVDVDTDAGFTLGRPRLLFARSGYSSGYPVRAYDLSLDSQRFLMVKLDERKPAPVTELFLIQNWLEELKARFAAAS
jgi:serine/threonine-protein kinase